MITSHEVRIEKLQGKPLAVGRRRARPQDVSRTVIGVCGAVWNVVRANNISGAGRNVALDLGRSNGYVNMEVGVEMEAPFAGHDELTAQREAVPVGESLTLAVEGGHAP